MLSLIQQSLTQLAATLQILSVAVAAVSVPAEYNVMPQELPLSALEAGFSLPENPTQGEIRAFIAQEAKRHGVSQVLALAIAECESQFKNVPNYKYDGEDGRYTAWGIFQITRTTARHTGLGLDRKDIAENIIMGIHLLKTDGEYHWDESRNCWSKML